MKISNFLFHLYIDYSSSNSLSPLWELSHMFDTPFFWTFLRFLSFFKLNTTHKECWSTVNSQSICWVCAQIVAGSVQDCQWGATLCFLGRILKVVVLLKTTDPERPVSAWCLLQMLLGTVALFKSSYFKP